MYFAAYEPTGREDLAKRDASRLVRRHTPREIIVARARLFVAMHHPQAWGWDDAPIQQAFGAPSGRQAQMTATWCHVPPEECSRSSFANAVALLMVGDNMLNIFTKGGAFLDMPWLDGNEGCEDLWIKALVMATS